MYGTIATTPGKTMGSLPKRSRSCTLSMTSCGTVVSVKER